MSRRFGGILGRDRRAWRGAVALAPVDGYDWGVLALVPDAALAIDSEGFIVGANDRAASMLAYLDGELIGVPLERLIGGHAAGHRRFGGDQGPSEEELDVTRKDGSTFRAVLSVSAVRSAAGRFSVFVLRDVSERVRTTVLMAAEKNVLEMIAAGAPLTDALQALTRSIEIVSPGMLASVLLLDADGRHLRHGAGPSLPQEYNDAIDGTEIGPSVGSCGTAAYSRKLVICSDIATDPRWRSCRDLALAHGLRACWSNPIISSGEAVLGTFALYYREPRGPAPQDIQLIERATHIAAIAIGRQNAERARHETEGRYRTLAELTSDFAYAFSIQEDGSAVVDWVTDAFSRITGYDIEEWESRGAWRGVVHPEDMLAFEQRLPRLLRGEDASNEVRIITKSGEVRWLYVYSRPEWDQGHTRVVRIVGAGQDFTQRKEAEDAKTMFLATASHELKTPLTVIRGFAQLMGDPRNGSSIDREASEAIERRAVQLNDIVDRIMMSSRIETGNAGVTVGSVDLLPIVSELTAALSASTGREVVLEASELPQVLADPDAVTTVIDHLLDNAVKYSPDGGTIRVKARADDRAVMLTVADEGIGMSPDQVARCFEKFWQAESTDVRRFGGTGIGLYIVHSLVEAMGGEAVVESEPGVGTAFTVILRRVDAAASDEGADPARPGAGDPSLIREFMRQIGVQPRSKP